MVKLSQNSPELNTVTTDYNTQHFWHVLDISATILPHLFRLSSKVQWSTLQMRSGTHNFVLPPRPCDLIIQIVVLLQLL